MVGCGPGFPRFCFEALVQGSNDEPTLDMKSGRAKTAAPPVALYLL
jgi:hypothetical protein